MFRTLLAGLLSILVFSIVDAQPKIDIVGGNERDFGNVYTGQIIKRTVTVRNTGFDTLRISGIKASCGCTGAMASSQVISPGDTSTVSIAFNSTGYKGSLAKNIRISSNDTTNALVYVYFKVNVLSAFDISPQFLTFVDYKIDSPMTRTVKLKNTLSSDVAFTKVVSTDPQVAGELRKKRLRPGEETELGVKFIPKKSGWFEGTINLITDFKEVPVITISFNASMKRDGKK